MRYPFKNGDDLTEQITTIALVDFVLWVAGMVLLSMAFGWVIGTGVGFLVYFHKHPY